MNLDGYIDVPSRLGMALTKFPELRVTESNPVIVKVGEASFVQVTTTVWRTPDDPIPCRATAWEPIPGRTPYTRDSEMMNASTSALGRALGLMGLGLKGSISTSDEIRNRTSDSSARMHPSREAGMHPSNPPQIRTDAIRPPIEEADPEGQIERPRSTKAASDPQKRLIRRLLAERSYDFDGDVETLTMGDAIELIDILKQLEPIR